MKRRNWAGSMCTVGQWIREFLFMVVTSGGNELEVNCTFSYGLSEWLN